ncbi:MAG TPA: hypothetical protein VN723_14410 [Rhizomicrobium sp.]|nr:hypothetical protein [Rhizomicrobium sp.]
MSIRLLFQTGLCAASLLALCQPCLAVTDEIQVYTGDIEPVGVAGLTWHNNYTLSGLKTPDFPGGLVDDRAYSSVTEWAYGVTPWFEAGLYLPLYSSTANQGWTYNGFKLRALFVQPGNEEKDFYYGVNFEFSWNQKQWDTQVNTGEIRPIIGWRFGDGFSLTLNPIVDNSYKGFNRLEFVPATRLDYRIDKQWTVAVEEYDDFGELRRFLPTSQQWHQLWAVADYTGDPVSVEAGIGFGLTAATDDVAAKVMFMTDLTGPHGLFAR